MNLVYVYNNNLKAHGYLNFSFTKVFINEHFLYASYKQIKLAICNAHYNWISKGYNEIFYLKKIVCIKYKYIFMISIQVIKIQPYLMDLWNVLIMWIETIAILTLNFLLIGMDQKTGKLKQ